MADSYGPYQNGQRVWCQSITSSQSIPNNTSVVRVIHRQQVSSGFVADSSWQMATYIGSSVPYNNTAYRDIRTTTVISDVSLTVGHNSNGTGSVWTACHSVAHATGYHNSSAGHTHTMATIPRATDPNWSGNFIAGESKTINLPRATGTFTHDVSVAFEGENVVIGTGVGVSVDWTPALSLLTKMTDSTAKTGVMTVVTKSGSTTIGTKTKVFTLEAGPSIVPTVTSVTAQDTNSTVLTNIGAYVQNITQLTASTSGSGVYDSTIVLTDASLDLGSGVYLPLKSSIPVSIPNSGTIPLIGTVTDSRGRSASSTSNINVLAYSPPQAQASVFRSDGASVAQGTGENLSMTLSAAVQSLLVGGTQKNSFSIKVETKLTSAAENTYIQRNLINVSGLVYNDTILIGGGAIYVQSGSYDVRLTITDKTGTISSDVQTITVATVTLDLVGEKVGIGKLHEDGVLDVGGDTYIRGSLIVEGDGEFDGDFNVEGDLNVNGDFTISGVGLAGRKGFVTVNSVSQSLPNGWTKLFLGDVRRNDGFTIIEDGLSNIVSFRPPQDGWYEIGSSVMRPPGPGSYTSLAGLYKNPNQLSNDNFVTQVGYFAPPSAQYDNMRSYGVAYLEVDTEYAFVFYHNSTTQSTYTTGSSAYHTRLSVISIDANAMGIPGPPGPPGPTGGQVVVNPVYFHAVMTANHSRSGTQAWAKVPFTLPLVNIGNGFDTGTNRFVAPVSGVYEFTSQFAFTSTSAGPALQYFKNGELSLSTQYNTLGYSNSYDVTPMIDIIELNVGDYVEVYMMNANSSSITLGFNYGTRFMGKLLYQYT